MELVKLGGKIMNKEYQKLIINNLEKLTKEDICEFMETGKLYKKKDELVSQLEEKIKGNELMIIKLYKEYTERFALDWKETEELLGCTKTERLRWAEEGKIKIAYRDSFYKYGKTLYAPYYDIISIYEGKEQVKRWREEYEKEKEINKQKAVEKAQQTKKENKQTRENFKKEFRKTLVNWYKIEGELGVTFELAFWTVWVSRWAKENQLKYYNARKVETRKKYKQNEMYLYELKNKANELLMKSPYTKISFYEPEFPDKYSDLLFCDYHYDLWCELRQLDYIPKWDFFWSFYDDIMKCSNCSVDINKGYYSLYHLEVSDSRIDDFSFSFHIPYPIGKKFLPSPRELQRVEHEEQDGIFRFGRPVFDDEKIIYTEKFVEKKIKETIDKFNLYLS